MNTPWGNSDYENELQEGVVIVGTPSHGGLMIRRDVAMLMLTPAAYNKGNEFSNYLCFEEDCDFSIAAFEMPHLWEKMFAEHSVNAHQRLMASISTWNADYLLARGIEPLPEQYEFWKTKVNKR